MRTRLKIMTELRLHDGASFLRRAVFPVKIRLFVGAKLSTRRRNRSFASKNEAGALSVGTPRTPAPEACRPQKHFACRKFLRKDVIAGVIAGVAFESVCRRAFISYASASTRYPTCNSSVCRSFLNRMPWRRMPRNIHLNAPNKRTSVFRRR